jgi:hypothetical protein
MKSRWKMTTSSALRKSPLSEEKKGADVQLGADTSAYISWFWTISPQRSSIYTHHISFLFFPFVSTVAIQKDVGGILSI